MIVPYYKQCAWCFGHADGPTVCTCTEPCSRPLCPMLDDGHLFSPLQPVPQFQKEETE